MREVIDFALSYPFEIPRSSFMFTVDQTQSLWEVSDDFRSKLPVLALGSNQSPTQLTRKYKGLSDSGEIPAERAILKNFDVVYAAHLAEYGSVPATFQSSPGTFVTIFVLWLTEIQLSRMHQTESNYCFDKLNGLEIKTEFGFEFNTAYAYVNRNGCLNIEGSPLALAEISAKNRHFDEATQLQAQEAVRDITDAGKEIETFVLETIEDASTRTSRIKFLAKRALQPTFDRTLIVDLSILI